MGMGMGKGMGMGMGKKKMNEFLRTRSLFLDSFSSLLILFLAFFLSFCSDWLVLV